MTNFVILRNWQSKEKHMALCKLATEHLANSFNTEVNKKQYINK